MFAPSRGAVSCRCSRCAVRAVRCCGLRIIDPMLRHRCFKTIQICLKNGKATRPRYLPGIEASLPRHLPGVGASVPSHTDHTDHTVIRSYGLALRHPAAPPARHRSHPPRCPGNRIASTCRIDMLKFSSFFIADQVREAFA